jgi:integrase/recombinase XerD
MLNENYENIKNEYAGWLITLGFSAKVVYDYKFRIQDFFMYLQAQQILEIYVLQQKHIDNYFEYLQIRKNKRRVGGLSISHLNHNFMAVDKLLEYLHQMGFGAAPIPTHYRITPDNVTRISNIQAFTQQDIKALQANIINTFNNFTYQQKEAKHEQLKLIFALYYGCGLRRMEGYNLKISDVNFEKKTIFIRQGKNYKDRIIPMNDTVKNILEHYIYNFRNLLKLKHKRLFINNTDCLAKSLQVLKEICDCESVKGKKITLHILRHSIATHLLQNGMSIENIALFLGHSSLESTQIYTHLI